MAGKGSGRQALDKVLLGIEQMASGELLPDFDDERTGLVLEPLRWVLEARDQDTPYRWLAFEQVPAVLPVWEAMAEVLRGLGYSVVTGKLHAEQYGVPQTRKRAILMASLDHEVSLPTATHSKYYSRTPDKLDPGVGKWVSMAEALGWGVTHRPSMTVAGGGSALGGAEPFGNGARKSIRREVEAGRWMYRTSTQANATRRDTDQPAPTLAFGHDAASVGWVHDRGFTRLPIPQAAALQTFPKGYPWQGTQGRQYQQIGNAIPPLLAKVILRGLI